MLSVTCSGPWQKNARLLHLERLRGLDEVLAVPSHVEVVQLSRLQHKAC